MPTAPLNVLCVYVCVFVCVCVSLNFLYIGSELLGTHHGFFSCSKKKKLENPIVILSHRHTFNLVLCSLRK